MKALRHGRLLAAAICAALVTSGSAQANDYREKGKTAAVAGSTMSVTPARDWNKLSAKPGKRAETWTLDGEQLNDVTFYGGILPGEPLVRERSKKHQPLPRFTSSTLLAEVPELLEGTYRAGRQIGPFSVTSSAPDKFLGRAGIRFSYEYTDADLLPRMGEARAAVVEGKLYMVTYDAPRLHFFARSLGDYHALADTIRLVS